MSENFVIGLDYGTDSVRSVVVNTASGETAGSAVFEYPRWKKRLYCDPSANMFRQHPLDYIEGLEASIREAIKGLDKGTIANIAALTVDTTGSTPVPVDEKGTPLSLIPGFSEDPDAMFVLWEDHTAVKEAAEINQLAKSWGAIIQYRDDNARSVGMNVEIVAHLSVRKHECVLTVNPPRVLEKLFPVQRFPTGERHRTYSRSTFI